MTLSARGAVAGLLLLVCAVSCQSARSQGEHSAPAKPPFGSEPQGRRQAAVTHIVLVWLKTPGDEAARRRVIERSASFDSIPGVVRVTSGTPLPSTRPVVDSSYDVAVVMTFASEAALRAYDAHPTHRRAAEEVLRPLARKILIYDFK